jgi:citrate/tricarballylate utilization protein
MERRVEFSEGDLNYLANLCHNCSECFYACQYAPPHEFAVNLPKTLAEIRLASYSKYCWPGVIRSGWIATAMAVVLSAIALALTPRSSGGDFYAAIPHGVMVAIFGAAGVLIILAWAIALARFWREDKTKRKWNVAAVATALGDIFKLTNLSSHGSGCTYPNETHSQSRRAFHHLTFYGFLLCFASTTVAAIYDNLFGWKAPYGYGSLPVILGALGGLGIVAGPIGLLALKARRDRRITDPGQDGMDLSLIGLLIASGITGWALLLLRSTHAMSALLAIHLGIVLALFISLPFGKFVHGIFRAAALLRNALEQRDGDQSENRGKR